MANLPSCKQSPGMWYCQGEGERYGESYNGFVEHGNDIAEPFHTPITALYGGTVVDTSYHGWGGQVGILANVPGYGTVVEYVQHLDTIASGLTPGSKVSAGQLLGLSGGQLSGGSHPNNPLYSSGPHVEFGFNAPWVAGINGASNKSGFNSQFAIDAAKNGQLTSGAGIGLPSINNPNSATNLATDPSIAQSVQQFHQDMSVANALISTFQNADWKNILPRAGLILGGIIIVIFGLAKVVG